MTNWWAACSNFSSWDMLDIYSREMEKADTDDDSASLFMRFLTLVQENCRECREVAWYASELCVTPKYLSAICQKITGKSALHWIEYDAPVFTE